METPRLSMDAARAYAQRTLDDLDEDAYDPDNDWESAEYYPIEPTEIGATDDEAAAMRTGYHGSGYDLRGDRIEPSTRRSGDVVTTHETLSPKHFVNYMTPNTAQRSHRGHSGDFGNFADFPDTPEERDRDAETEAWNWAADSARVAMSLPEERRSPGDGRPRVYEGRAVDVGDGRPIGLDTNLTGMSDWEARAFMEVDHSLPMAAPAFEVTDTHWIPPSKNGRAVQGTLPHVNWNQFGAPNMGNPEDVRNGKTQLDYQHGDMRANLRERAEAAALRRRDTSDQQRAGRTARIRSRIAERGGQMRLPGMEDL